MLRLSGALWGARTGFVRLSLGTSPLQDERPSRAVRQGQVHRGGNRREIGGCSGDWASRIRCTTSLPGVPGFYLSSSSWTMGNGRRRSAVDVRGSIGPSRRGRMFQFEMESLNVCSSVLGLIPEAVTAKGSQARRRMLLRVLYRPKEAENKRRGLVRVRRQVAWHDGGCCRNRKAIIRQAAPRHPSASTHTRLCWAKTWVDIRHRRHWGMHRKRVDTDRVYEISAGSRKQEAGSKNQKARSMQGRSD